MNAATVSTISRWFDDGVLLNRRYMIVWCDDFDYEDYPAYYPDDESAQNALDNPSSMQRAMECYDLMADKQDQLNLRRAWALRPKRSY